jgi:hypothetical protein
MTLDEALEHLSGIFAFAPGIGDAALAPTGEPYIVICSGGEKKEGGCPPLLCRDKETAIRLWHEAILIYGFGRRWQNLYWREKPHIETVYGDWYYVYSRLLISDKSCCPPHGGGWGPLTLSVDKW